MDWLRSEDLKEETVVTTPITTMKVFLFWSEQYCTFQGVCFVYPRAIHHGNPMTTADLDTFGNAAKEGALKVVLKNDRAR